MHIEYPPVEATVSAIKGKHLLDGDLLRGHLIDRNLIERHLIESNLLGGHFPEIHLIERHLSEWNLLVGVVVAAAFRPAHGKITCETIRLMLVLQDPQGT